LPSITEPNPLRPRRAGGGRHLCAAGGARPQTPPGGARLVRPPPKAACEADVRRDRERARVAAGDEQLVDEAPVAQPDVDERATVAVARLRTDRVAYAAPAQHALGERRRLRAEALAATVDLRRVDPDQAAATDPAQHDGVAVDDARDGRARASRVRASRGAAGAEQIRAAGARHGGDHEQHDDDGAGRDRPDATA
jgi:hypothetical protein